METAIEPIRNGTKFRALRTEKTSEESAIHEGMIGYAVDAKEDDPQPSFKIRFEGGYAIEIGPFTHVPNFLKII